MCDLNAPLEEMEFQQEGGGFIQNRLEGKTKKRGGGGDGKGKEKKCLQQSFAPGRCLRIQFGARNPRVTRGRQGEGRRRRRLVYFASGAPNPVLAPPSPLEWTKTFWEGKKKDGRRNTAEKFFFKKISPRKTFNF